MTDEFTGVTGAEILAQMRAAHPNAARVLLTRHGTIEAAMLATKATGLHGYVPKPWDPPQERLYPILDELLEDWRAREATQYLVVETIMDAGDDVARIRSGATLFDAAQMVADTRVGDLMVVEENAAFVGVLSEGDILRNALVRLLPAPRRQPTPAASVQSPRRTPARFS